MAERSAGDAPSGFSCPAPLSRYEHIVLGHGSGGRLSHELIELFARAFDIGALEDAARVFVDGAAAFTTDAFVVRPLFFPGGDVGKLAVCGTVNDLAVMGATPRYLSAAFILEEGLPITDLVRIVASMRAAAHAAGVRIVCGDTKVVERGKGDGCFIATTGIGTYAQQPARPARVAPLSIHNARPGDLVLVSGTLGDHGIAVTSVREGLSFETTLESDCADLSPLCRALIEACAEGLRCMRDATRGGLTSVLHELAAASGVGVQVDEAAVPVKPAVRGACELLGLDALYVANEGKLVAVVAEDRAPDALAALRAHPLGRDAAVVGRVVEERAVTVRSVIGGERMLSLLSGEQLPRIC